MMKEKLSKLERSWILYDVGNSAFVLLVSTIIPIYFKYLAGNANISSTDYLAYWGYAASVSTIIVAVLGPLLGAISDRMNHKKPLFLGSVILGGLGCCLLGLTPSWMIFLIIFIFSKIGFSISLIFYDSMLTDVTTPKRMDQVSSKGYAWGYIGSCIPLLLSLALVLGYEWIGISFQTAMLLAFIITAVWWLILSVPLIVHYKQIYAITETKNSITSSFSQLGNTFSDMIKHRQILFFLVAFFFYIDGVYTIIDMATAYGEALGLNTTGLLLALLLTQVIAFPCALIFGKLSKRFAPERLISLCIIAYIGISIFAIQLNQQWEFWFLAVCVGMFQGGIQALSRSYFAKIIPAEKSGEYFGILDICGKGASFIGTTLVSLITQITGHSEAGVSIISVIMIIGFILFRITVHQENQYTNSATKISVSNTK